MTSLKNNELDNLENSAMSSEKFPSSDIELGNRIKQVIDAYPNRQQAMAASEVSDISLRRYVAGAVQPSFMTLSKLALGIGIRLE